MALVIGHLARGISSSPISQDAFSGRNIHVMASLGSMIVLETLNTRRISVSGKISHYNDK